MRFQYRLALALNRTHAELMHTVSAAELAYWFALWTIEPWGEFRAEASRALVGSAVCASFGGKVKPADLIPDWDRDTKKRGMNATDFAAFVATHNAKITKGAVGIEQHR